MGRLKRLVCKVFGHDVPGEPSGVWYCPRCDRYVNGKTGEVLSESEYLDDNRLLESLGSSLSEIGTEPCIVEGFEDEDPESLPPTVPEGYRVKARPPGPNGSSASIWDKWRPGNGS